MTNALPMASINWSSPLFWAIMIGWIISVTIHEFSHGLVAYLGGDYTIRERGGLSLNPLKYVNPIMTFALPLLCLLMGAVPLMGAATYIRTDLLRNRFWRSFSAAAGPLANLVLFFLCAVPLYPRWGWVDPLASPDQWSALQVFCGAMCVLQLFAVFINLVPIPPLDGFRIVEPYLPPAVVKRTRDPQIALGILLLLFFLLSTDRAGEAMRNGLFGVLNALHFDPDTQNFIRRSYNIALFGGTD
jgi:Zn-dependent protease